MQVSSIITMEDTPELRLGVRCVLLQLFEHNEKAYRAAVQMMEECGKAAIVHPTGTGKSYIAFKLIEEHPADTIFWLSPSEYIFKTQIENLKRQAPDISLANVHFYTYAKLMCCATEELEAIAGLNPTYIILDEFHRVGAECWGASTLELLKRCPDAKILGLSATNIRYLDNNRDMAEELFDGHIASEMTLGEAIVRGILPAPKYVTTVYQYQKELTRYQNRIDNLRSAGIQDVNQKYLDKVFCAPNKIYEYSGFGIPMLANDIPGLKNTVGNAGAAECMELKSNNIVHAIQKIEEDYDTYSENAKKFFAGTDNLKTMKKLMGKITK